MIDTLKRQISLLDELIQLEPKNQEIPWMERYKNAIKYDLDKALKDGGVAVSEADDNVRALEEFSD